MKMVSKIALAATLVVGLNGAVLLAPALAKKEPAADGAPAITPAVRAALVVAQTALAATPKDLAGAETSVATAEAAAQTDYDRYLCLALRLSLTDAKTRGSTDAQRAAALVPLLDAVIANPSTPKTEVALRYNERGALLYGAQKFAPALQSFISARDGGYTDRDLLLNIARSRVSSGDVVGGIGDLDVAVKAEQAAGRKVPDDWYRYAISHLYQINAPGVDDWTRRWLTDYGTAANWRAAIYQFGLTGPNAAKFAKNRLDLYRLLYATKSLAGQAEYFNYADAAVNVVGLPEEARTVLRDGFANGAIPAGDPSATALQKSVTAKLVGSTSAETKEKRAVAGSDGDLARQAGDGYLAVRNFPKAAEMYQLALTKHYADTDRANLHLGMALAQAGDRAGAKAALAKVSGEPNASIARLWTTYVVAAPAA